jgi:hypothetical protein
MTLILELTPAQEERLAADAARSGVDTETYALRRLFDGGDETTPPEKSLAERLRDLGVLGAVKGTKRADGRPWSEIEAACDPL